MPLQHKMVFQSNTTVMPWLTLPTGNTADNRSTNFTFTKVRVSGGGDIGVRIETTYDDPGNTNVVRMWSMGVNVTGVTAAHVHARYVRMNVQTVSGAPSDWDLSLLAI
jgi:hypothetical protein